MKKFFMKVFFFILLVLTLLGILNASLNTYAIGNNEINLNVKSRKKLEVVLSKNESNMDVTNFQNDVYDKLRELNVDTSLVEFHDAQREEVSTTQSDAGTIFRSWGRAGSTGQWSYNNGEIINAENTANMTGFYYPNNYNYQDITLNYESTSTDGDDDAMGGMIRFNKNSDDKFSCYVFLITNSHDSWCNHSGIYNNYNLSIIVGLEINGKIIR